MRWNYSTRRAVMLMRDCGQLARTLMWNSIDWRRPEIRDGALIFGAVAAIYACAHFYDLPPQLFQFGMDNADWEVDDIIFVIFVMSIGFAV